jgi:hypothetical protein
LGCGGSTDREADCGVPAGHIDSDDKLLMFHIYGGLCRYNLPHHLYPIFNTGLSIIIHQFVAPSGQIDLRTSTPITPNFLTKRTNLHSLQKNTKLNGQLRFFYRFKKVKNRPFQEKSK